jgi:hypothetical protein
VTLRGRYKPEEPNAAFSRPGESFYNSAEMVDDQPPKTAYELAMERLRKRDEETGAEHRRLTDEQKAAIAEVRSFYQAKIAEQEVLQQSRLRKTADPAERESIEAELRRDRELFVSERDAKIEKIRRGEPL